MLLISRSMPSWMLLRDCVDARSCRFFGIKRSKIQKNGRETARMRKFSKTCHRHWLPTFWPRVKVPCARAILRACPRLSVQVGCREQLSEATRDGHQSAPTTAISWRVRVSAGAPLGAPCSWPASLRRLSAPHVAAKRLSAGKMDPWIYFSPDRANCT